jgi:hypothetical protein
MSLVPVLQTRYDDNGIPVSAKCSLCGEQMLQGKPRITNPIENLGPILHPLGTESSTEYSKSFSKW